MTPDGVKLKTHSTHRKSSVYSPEPEGHPAACHLTTSARPPAAANPVHKAHLILAALIGGRIRRWAAQLILRYN